jgi:hypothetical protein
MRTGFPDLHLTVRDSGVSGGKLWARVEFSGTNTGEMMGKPPTGKRVSLEALACVRFEGDKLAEHWGAIDMFGLLIQLGHIPAPARQPASTGLRAPRSAPAQERKRREAGGRLPRATYVASGAGAQRLDRATD